MESSKNNLELPWYIKTAHVLLMVTLVVYGMIVANSILVPFTFALFFAILLIPLANQLERLKLPRLVASLVSMLIGLLLLIGMIIFFYSQLSVFAEDIDLIQERLRSLFEDFQGMIGSYVEFNANEFLENIEDTIVGYIGSNVESLGKGLVSAASTLTLAFIIPIYIILLLTFRSFLKEFFIRAFSNGNSKRIEKLLNRVKGVVQHYILGMLIVIIILAILNTTLLLILGVKHAVFFGVFAAMLNIVPFVGPLVGSILPILFALLTTDSLLIPFLVLLGFYIIQLFESNLFTPGIVGRQVSLNPLVTLLAIFIGAQIWGLVGMILFIPVGAVLKVIFDEIDSLKPLGFLMGKANPSEKPKKGLAKKVEDLLRKIKTKDNN